MVCVVSVPSVYLLYPGGSLHGRHQKPSGFLDILVSLKLLFRARLGSLRLAKGVKESGEEEFLGFELG